MKQINMTHSKVIASIMISASFLANAKDDICEKSSIEQARKLLNFHTNGDTRIEIDRDVVLLKPLRNPINKNQLFSVYEVGGVIYKANYRMRIIYYKINNDCLLMGQEVLELSSP
jgi:hypothetical protein